MMQWQYRQVSKLSPMERQQVTQVIEVCHQADHTADSPYLENSFNVYPAMPAFILAYQGPVLGGFATIYADDTTKASVNLLVAPLYRRQGVGQELLQRTQTILKTWGYPVPEVEYITEQAFLAANRDFLTNWQLDVLATGEYLMEYDAQLVKPVQSQPSQVQVTLAQRQDIDQIAQVNYRSFKDSTLALYQRYAAVNYQDELIDLYKITLNDVIIGSAAVECGQEMAYIFSLAITPAHQGRGLGKAAVKELLTAIALTRVDLPIRLNVEISNLPAYKVYCANGFKKLTEIVYLEKAH
ncbi:ribosomal protein S18 acetylase RimI-like enzyme [Weissella beninensis]|uniref:GNAT family N-acetyltransferase n=1 Tax=Periweissella beninensis TaxID=504936 RepID=A0ABT0VHL9_9LACO|nr:GNAT family N-acetyltransferase [Periweissella beninensis]MBM7543365.1 ribosomal protein S18 acetylase RimI-like enzyme [Periweissella beninensis]MCM2437338.1 GNAT family N-acetyltransferase [Periweissella beninensis]